MYCWLGKTVDMAMHLEIMADQLLLGTRGSAGHGGEVICVIDCEGLMSSAGKSWPQSDHGCCLLCDRHVP